MPLPSAGDILRKLPISKILNSADALRKIVPILEDEVTVEVLGQPGASKKTLYFLALAVANSLVRRYAALLQLDPLLPPTFGMIMIEYDASDNWVRCTLRYQGNIISAAISRGTIPQAPQTPAIPVFAGPDCDVKGAPFDFRSDILPGLPAATGTSNPILPFNGRTILTPCPTVPEPVPGDNPPSPNVAVINSPNPKPPGDNRSRGIIVGKSTTAIIGTKPPTGTPELSDCCEFSAKLVPLVMAALTDPGSLNKEQFKGPTQGPSGS